jgi:hypothetical protein
MFLKFFFYEGGRKTVNRKHCAAPPRVLPIRHPKRVALPEDAHPQLAFHGKANPPVS